MNTKPHIVLNIKKVMRSTFFTGIVLSIPYISKAQLTQGISINTTGNANYTGAILDLSNHNTAGTSEFFLLMYFLPVLLF